MLPLLIVALAASGRVFSGEPLKPSTYRPYPDIPELLWYAGFEDENVFKTGKVIAEAPCAPETHALKLANVDWNKAKGERWVSAWGEFSRGLISIPGGMDPKEIRVQLNVWSDAPGDVVVKLKHSTGEYASIEHYTTAKAWAPLVFSVGEMRAGKNHPEPAHVCTVIEISFKSKSRTEYPNVSIDSVLVTYVAPPAAVLPKMVAREKKAADMRRALDKDGFKYTLEGQELLFFAMKNTNFARRDKTILVALPRAEDAPAFTTQLSNAAKKIKSPEYKLLPLSKPGGAAVGGMDDLRAFLPHNLRKTDPQLVLLVLSPAQLLGTRPLEGMQAVLERTLAGGSVPIVALPPPKPEIAAVVATITALCDKLGVPYMDGAFAVKGIAAPLEGNEISAPAMEGIANLASTALKHAGESLARK